MDRIDHWRSIDLGEPRKRSRSPPTPPPSPNKRNKPERKIGPRLNMGEYTYPPDFELGDNERLRGLNGALLKKFRTIGDLLDHLSEAEEIQAYDGDHYANSRSNLDRVTSVQTQLNGVVADAEALIAEVNAIGGHYHMPPMLEGKVPVTNYVPPGSMRRLILEENFFEENLEHVVTEEYKNRVGSLNRISYLANRMVFLQECGDRYTKNSSYYRGLRDQLKREVGFHFSLCWFEKMPLLPFDTMPALFDRVEELLGLPRDQWRP